jgi:hypothetical protein
MLTCDAPAGVLGVAPPGTFSGRPIAEPGMFQITQ